MTIGALFQPKTADIAVGGGTVSPSFGSASIAKDEEPVLIDKRLKMKPKESLHVLIQLRAMLSAGVPLLAALRTLRQHSQTPHAEKALERIATIVEGGHDLSWAIECLPRCFDSFVVHLLAAGERAGAMDESIGRAVELQEKQIKLTGKIRAALAYPSFLLGMTFVMTIGILIFLVPKFENLLMSKPELLPSTTQMVLGLSTFLRESPILAASMGMLFALGALIIFKSRKVQEAAFDSISHLPVIGTLIHKAFIARSVNTLALTLESGVPILAGLGHAAEVAQLPRLRALWEGAVAVVRDGRPLHTALENENLPPALIQMVVAGESSGSLDTSLRTAAGFLDRETDAALEVFTGLLGPATVVIAGAVVGFIVVSLMTPILQMANFVG
ncbi:MAG: type II secretion system F family protein [Planctomycetota bacterium]|jgi:type IV pilus assembly protein PilC|nr:type II secretion system F family protein [Planctomycetota bacterium]MDP6941651.1 type II secretion system F family protein [Planctomycetota bacterium]